MRKIFGLVLALALVAAACGGDNGPDPSDDPKGALQAALDRLAEYEGVSLTMSIASDTASLVAASEGDLTEDNAQKVIDSSITLSAVQSDDPSNAQFQLAANIAGIENAFEMRAADNTLYLRADVTGLADAFGADTSQLDAFEAQAGSAPGFEFVGPALAGEWIGLTGLDTAMDQLGAGTGAVETPSEEDLAAIKKFTDALGDAAEVTLGDKEGPGDNLVATVNLREAYSSLTEIAGSVVQVPGSELPPDSEIPDKDIAIDVWIDGGNLTQAEFDLTQLADLGDSPMPEGVDHLAFRIGIAEFTGGVEAPDGATEVDLMQIFSGLMGGGIPGMDTGESGEVPMDICDQLADQLEGQPQEVIDQVLPQFEAECPDLADQLGQ